MEYSRSKFGTKYKLNIIKNLDTQYHLELKNMLKGQKCTDCNSNMTNWATLKRGAFICIDCAQKLRADATNKVKSCMGTYLWHPDEMEIMRKKYNSIKS